MNTNNKSSVNYAAILTAFNCENTIDDALDSILSQDEKPGEIWIVDDYSTDLTRKKLDYWVKKRTDINLILNSANRGQSYSRNIAAKKSCSDLFIFFDDDDFSKSNRSSEHLRMYVLGSEINYVSSEKIYENGYVTFAQNIRNEMSRPLAAEIVRQLVIGRIDEENRIGWIPSSTLAISSKTFNRIGGFDENLRRLEDSDLAIRAAEYGAKFSWSDQICVSRKSTISTEKGGVIETNNEMYLLNKYRKFLSNTEYRDGKNLIKIRSFYFGKRYFSFIFYTLIHPSIIFFYPTRVLRFTARLLHDYRIAKHSSG